jgi:hypothetical protein
MHITHYDQTTLVPMDFPLFCIPETSDNHTAEKKLGKTNEKFVTLQEMTPLSNRMTTNLTMCK